MTNKQNILILLFHPLLHKSRVNRELLRSAEDLEGVTLRMMYDLYPDFHINVREEQKLLQEHDVIIWQHPFYWYSSPALLKEWIDIVLEHGFAYGREGKALEGKKVMTAISTGGRREVYQAGGIRKYSIRHLLAPFEQTVNLCNMNYLPPFVVHGTHLLDANGIAEAGKEYRKILQALRDDIFNDEELFSHEYLNDLIA
ncbi:MAG: NAD(P)H-dependent oxidoreductase [Bacteroidales bacterium]|nr:NAD(P)H-dependent oxidoreductase [Bacteroidales bacterium]